jgi:Fe-S cluster assembly protein SufB
MARFAQKHTSDFDPKALENYQHGYSFPTSSYSRVFTPGLTPEVVEEISHIKEEPEWMLQTRRQALAQFEVKPMPPWGADLSGIEFDKIRYYLRPTDAAGKSWSDVPKDVKETFDRLGIPEAERQVLAGVKAQYDSEVVYGSLQDVWAKEGVIFLSMDEGLKQYPDLVKQYFGTVIPSGDNKFSALNTAVWSGGSFVYVPPGVEVKMPLQTYFRINAENAGQFERTLIIVDEGAKVHYIEGCFIAGTKIETEVGRVAIEDITTEDLVYSHTGQLRKINHTQVRPYSGSLYSISVRGNPHEVIQATSEHPFLAVKRQRPNERNSSWNSDWVPASQLKKNDYLCIPIDQRIESPTEYTFSVPKGRGRHGYIEELVSVTATPEFFRLIGYYLAEGSISNGHYLNFSFSEKEEAYIKDVCDCISQVFGEHRFSQVAHKKNHGISVVVRSTRLCRVFEQFGTHSSGKQIPQWVMVADKELQKQVILGWHRGDGNYYRKTHKDGFKEVFRCSTTSESLVYQARMILARLGIASSVNKTDRSNTHRQTMYTLVIGGEYMVPFGALVGQPVQPQMWGKKRATFFHVDEKYLYAPISSISTEEVKNIDVYNFSVEKDESYIAGGVAVHNCTAPSFSTGSLHSAVVEIIVKKGARCQYTTIQNWYKNVYNLVTKRALVGEEGEMVWTDFNMGSKVTMKYPGFILAGKGARGETLSMALAGAGQHQDTGSKAIHLAPYTSSTIISKSISKNGGRTSYRGLVSVGPNAHHSKNTVVCDALLLDDQSRSDTYPDDKVFNSQVEVQHEATVSKIGDDQLFYLMSRGMSEEGARKLIVNGFIDGLVRKLPLEYAVEMNRLIDYEMEGSIG